MEETTKTYAVEGMRDWEAQISVGASSIRVPFAGGSFGRYGMHPATFTTKNPAVQAIIENSNYFKQGRITLLKEIKPKSAAEQAKPKKEEPKELEQVEVTSLQDAIERLKEYGYTARQLTSKEKVIAIAKIRGIEFIGI